jgi:HK97 family phage major capsid protein
VNQAKEGSQTAATVVYKNVVKMFNRHVSPQNADWLMHPDVLEQLMFMEFPVGTGGVPVFLPPGGASASPFGTLLGRPIVSTDQCSALGTSGDIVFSDLSDYILIAKGGTRAESSMHVRFLNDEQTFRFIFRANGQPKNRSTLTLKNTSTTRSTNVTLADRA